MSPSLPGGDTATTAVSPTRNPLTDIAKKIGTGWSAVAGVVGALVTYGVLSGAQGDAITAVGAEAQSTVTAFGTVLGGFLPLVSALVAAFSTAKTGEGHVTPLSDPRDQQGRALTPDTVPPRVPGDGIGDHRRDT